MRIAGQMKLGYYPADPGLAMRLARLVLWPSEKSPDAKPVAVLDPCCGCGEALAAFAPPGARTYGIELAHNRYEAAAQRLTAVLNSGFETTRLTERSLSACWLNPPYDDELGGGKRTELEFVQRVSPLLAPGGVLVFFMAGRAANGRMATYLTSYYEKLRRFRHPPTDRNGYAQANVEIWIGVRRPMAGPAGSYLEIEDLPEEGSPPLWTAPPCRPLRTFEKWGYTDEELAELASRSPAWKVDGGGPVALGRPLLPLKLGHIPMVLASGRLNGCIGDHLARARIEKQFETVEVRTHVDDKGRVTGQSEVQREKVKLSIRCLARRNGEARVFNFA